MAKYIQNGVPYPVKIMPPLQDLDPTPIETNEIGGQQSKLDVRYDLIPKEALEALAVVFAAGAKRYAPNNWRKIDSESHLNHMMNHVIEYRKNPTKENLENASHALCRATMWFSMVLEELMKEEVGK
jgi:hypothetical protein